MKQDIITRRASKEDALSIVEMVADLAAFHGDQTTLTAEQINALAFTGTPWITLIVAEYENEIVGYAALCPLIQLQFAAKGMDIHHLFVKTEYRNMGIGSRLIDTTVSESVRQGCSYVAVGTHASNTVAQKIYLACGFNLVAPGGPRFRINVG